MSTPEPEVDPAEALLWGQRALASYLTPHDPDQDPRDGVADQIARLDYPERQALAQAAQIIIDTIDDMGEA